MQSEPGPAPPHTPTRNASEPPQPEPNSSRVTINLRTARPLDTIPSSPQSPVRPTKMTNGGEDAGIRISTGSGSDVLSTVPAIETPISSPSALGSPEIEILTVHDDDGFITQGPSVAIIGGDEDLFEEAVLDFPYRDDEESPLNAAKRVAQFFQWRMHSHYIDSATSLTSVGDIENDECFCKLRDWIDSHLDSTEDAVENWYDGYTKHRDFWKYLPEIVFALSWRR